MIEVLRRESAAAPLGLVTQFGPVTRTRRGG
jgi:hypothetical protein